MVDENALFNEGPVEDESPVMEREAPEVSQQRRALVNSMTTMVKEAKSHWDKTFRHMEKDARFCAGEQWPSESKSGFFNDDFDDRYIANITLRHVQQRVAALYAKNPRALARKRKRLLSTVWDGNPQSLQMAMGLVQSAQQAQMAAMQPQIDPMTGMPMPPPPPPDPVAVQQAQMVIEDAKAAKAEIDQINKIAQTLEILYDYEVHEQAQPFKSMMKLVIRRAATMGVGWVKVGFQRVMGKSPDFDTRMADLEGRLSMIERITADIADGEMQPESAEAEQLRLAMADLMNEQEIVLREGLQFSYPKPTAIIPDPRCVQLRDFLGCDWVAEEYCLSVNEIKETYGVDVGKGFTPYERMDTGTDYERARSLWQSGASMDNEQDDRSRSALVWEIYNKRDGLVYVLCDGYKDFLREPASPDPWIERFFPWFAVMFNETEGRVYPPSDVQLIRPMQLELNRMRQGLREHRFANRPKTVYAEGLLSQDDLQAFKDHPVNALIAISGLQPGQSIEQVVQPMRGVPVDPNLYEVNPVFTDLLRVTGDQEANLGGTAEATATETQVAQQSRSTAMGSAVDDLDETLSGIAKASGEILLLNVGEETVKEIVGPGAVWPTLTKAEVARNVYLEIEAASSGRPDQATAVMNFERLGPILMQLPGVTPLFLAKEAIKRLDDKLDINEAFSEGAASIMAQNAAAKGPAGPMQGPLPAAQGGSGGANAERPPAPSSQSPGLKASQPMGPQGGPPVPVG